MNAPNLFSLPDIQASPDTRNIAIDAVGVRDVRYPIRVASAAVAQSTIARFSLEVGLPAGVKGTHMSRFIELLESHSEPYSLERLPALCQAMLARLGAASGNIELRFPFFIKKRAPVSGVESLLDIDTCWRVTIAPGQPPRLTMRVLVPATSLCPCSKEISAYGAHNQRSHIGIEVSLRDAMTVEELIAVAERAASCEVYGLLKRADEKYVTERAYDNPQFVEDLVRDIAVALNADERIGSYLIEAENFESIHNHTAYARIGRA